MTTTFVAYIGAEGEPHAFALTAMRTARSCSEGEGIEVLLDNGDRLVLDLTLGEFLEAVEQADGPTVYVPSRAAIG